MTLMTDITLFASECQRIKNPSDVVECLHRRVAVNAELRVLAIWQPPLHDPKSSELGDYRLGDNIWFQRDLARTNFWNELKPQLSKNGPSTYVRWALRELKADQNSMRWRAASISTATDGVSLCSISTAFATASCAGSTTGSCCTDRRNYWWGYGTAIAVISILRRHRQRSRYDLCLNRADNEASCRR